MIIVKLIFSHFIIQKVSYTYYIEIENLVICSKLNEIIHNICCHEIMIIILLTSLTLFSIKIIELVNSFKQYSEQLSQTKKEKIISQSYLQGFYQDILL